jgi:hypothetical protein
MKLSEKKNLIEQKKQLKKDLKRKWDGSKVVKNGKVIWVSPELEQNFRGRIADMKLTGKTEIEWMQGFEFITLTLDELEEIVAEGTILNAQYFDDYKAAVKALMQ